MSILLLHIDKFFTINLSFIQSVIFVGCVIACDFVAIKFKAIQISKAELF